MTQIAAALCYLAAYPDEIEAAISDNACGPEALRCLIPNLEIVEADAAAD